MRQIHIQARQKQQEMLEKAREDKEAAQKEAARERKEILQSRKSLNQAIAKLKAKNQKHKDGIASQQEKLELLSTQEKKIDEDIEATSSTVNELAGAIRVNAKDIDALVQDSGLRLSEPQAREILDGIIQEDEFPGMDDIRMMSGLLQEYIHRSGQVRIDTQEIVDRSGDVAEAEVLFIGDFTAAYCLPDENGFLDHSSDRGHLFALSSLPSWRMQKAINNYMDGEGMAVPMDISRGGALRQLTYKLSPWEQLMEAGPLVWPIIFLFGLGLLIILERMLFMFRKRFQAESFMHTLGKRLRDGRIDICRQNCDQHPQKPLPRVIKAGLACCHLPREEMENALQEAILREIPPMERFLSTLGMLAAIAPLFGLLGTVTGMINTFQVITVHGTGDPGIMSGGISEALVTTMLGLSVAIPMLMAHTWLSRAVEYRIGEMEEKAMSLVNMIHTTKHAELDRVGAQT
jgi:biopolymer transport protein ExbB